MATPAPAVDRPPPAAVHAADPPPPHPLLLPLVLVAGGLLAADLVLGAGAGPLHLVAVATAGAAGLLLWRALDTTRRRANRLAGRVTETAVDADARQEAVAGLFVDLARRNQSLVDRQLALIGDMEQHESDPDALTELFQLDHLATRIRRHAESLLVLAGDETPGRSWRHPVLLSEVARAAAAEVEDYKRVDVQVGEGVEIVGRVVADLAHLLAELVENATTYSPAERRVQVRSYAEASGDAARPAIVVAVEDNGIGMSEADRRAANHVLAHPLVLDLRGHTMGMHVVSRLAHRYGILVQLDPTPGGGITALVTLPPDLVGESDPGRATPPSALPHRPHFTPATTFTPAPPTGAAPSPFTGADPTGGGRLPARTPGAGRPLPALAAAPPAEVAPSEPSPPAPSAPPGPSAGVVGLTAVDPADLVADPLPAPVEDGRSTPASDAPRSTARREHVRSMLSRFQASQRAGRALADAPPGSLAPTSTAATATRPVSQEDS